MVAILSQHQHPTWGCHVDKTWGCYPKKKPEATIAIFKIWVSITKITNFKLQSYLPGANWFTYKHEHIFQNITYITKKTPKLVAKILATNFGVLLWNMQCFQKCVQYHSNNNVIKYYGSVLPHDWDMSFEKFRGLPTTSFFRKWNFQGRTNYFFLNMSSNKFGEVPPCHLV